MEPTEPTAEHQPSFRRRPASAQKRIRSPKAALTAPAAPETRSRAKRGRRAFLEASRPGCLFWQKKRVLHDQSALGRPAGQAGGNHEENPAEQDQEAAAAQLYVFPENFWFQGKLSLLLIRRKFLQGIELWKRCTTNLWKEKVGSTRLLHPCGLEVKKNWGPSS